VGSRLESAMTSYEKAHNQLSSGKGSLVSRTVRLQTLGAKTRKQIDAKLLEEDSESD